jgi:hypothetical protein
MKIATARRFDFIALLSGRKIAKSINESIRFQILYLSAIGFWARRGCVGPGSTQDASSLISPENQSVGLSRVSPSMRLSTRNTGCPKYRARRVARKHCVQAKTPVNLFSGKGIFRS